MIFFTINSKDDETFGSLTFGSKIVPIDSEDVIDIDLTSFDELVNVTFIYESLPLDDLFLDNVRVETKPCASKNKTWLNCLEYSAQMDFPRCSNTQQLNLNYTFNNYEEYKDINIKKSFYKRNLNIKCIKTILYNCLGSFKGLFFKNNFFVVAINSLDPPVVQFQSQTKGYSELNQIIKIPLVCKVECGNPSRFSYTWKNKNDVLYTYTNDEDSNTYEFSFTPESIDDQFEIECKVTNGMEEAPNSDSSLARFIIVHESKLPIIPDTTSDFI